MTVMLMMNPAEYGSKLQEFPTAQQVAKSRSDVVCLITGTNCGVRPPESPNRYILIGCSSKERTSADVCFKQFPGYYMKMTLTIISCCTVSVTIPDILRVKREILLCSR